MTRSSNGDINLLLGRGKSLLTYLFYEKNSPNIFTPHNFLPPSMVSGSNKNRGLPVIMTKEINILQNTFYNFHQAC